MEYPQAKEKKMKCTVAGCSGEYRERFITQVFDRQGRIIVVEDIPAQVCDVCGDILLVPKVVERLVKTDAAGKEPVKFAPVFEYEAMAGV